MLGLLVALPLRLLPPGWSEKPHPLDSTRLHMPAALAQGSRAGRGDGPVLLHAEVAPAPARLGQRLRYQAWVLTMDGTRAAMAPPESSGDFTWSDVRAGHAEASVAHGQEGFYHMDSLWVTASLQVFRTGVVPVPGGLVRVTSPGKPGESFDAHLPTVRLYVLPTVTPSDSAATLRPLHGPLGAPWWERIAWRIVAAVLALLALAGVAVVAWRRRRRRPAPVAAPPRAYRPPPDPAAEALAALARLREEHMPALGRFGEHSLALTRILRRYLEATLRTPRPGDTSPELLAHLRAAGLDEDDVRRLAELLGLWDRVKFARAPLDAAEAVRCEDAVEAFVRGAAARGGA